MISSAGIAFENPERGFALHTRQGPGGQTWMLESARAKSAESNLQVDPSQLRQFGQLPNSRWPRIPHWSLASNFAFLDGELPVQGMDQNVGVKI